MFKVLLLLILVNIIIGLKKSKPLTQELIENLRKDIISRIITFTRNDDEGQGDLIPLFPTLIRLVFHDCGGSINPDIPNSPGICNGCINIIDEDHRGLEFGAIYPLQQVYTNNPKIKMDIAYGYKWTEVDGTFKGNPSGIRWNKYLTISDFWSIAGTIALEFGVFKSYDKGETELPTLETFNVTIKYYYGRSDCKRAPFEDKKDDFFNANAVIWDFDRVAEFLNTKFGLTKEESAALMGAHTLGRAHRQKNIYIIGKKNMYKDNNCCDGSGFVQKWKISPDTFNNIYYLDLENIPTPFPAGWVQVPANDTVDDKNGVLDELMFSIGALLPDSSKPSLLKAGLMLNVDMGVFYDINDNDDFEKNGYVNCIHIDDPINKNTSRPVCGFKLDIRDEFIEYQDSNQVWLEDFFVAWYKMIQAGYDDLKCLEKTWETTVDDYEELMLIDIDVVSDDDDSDENSHADDAKNKNILLDQSNNNIFVYYNQLNNIQITLINIFICILITSFCLGMYKNGMNGCKNKKKS